MACASMGVTGLVLVLSLSVMVVSSKDWIVGDGKGWTFGVSGWEKGKIFVRDDYLIFNYKPKMHNVLEVATSEYKACDINAIPSRNFTSGHDRVQLVGVVASYICGTPGHCGRGMKIHMAIEDKE
ncbi:hypothetical protein VPH35_036052 [Triticum aestivum]|uniref:Phytocyanin domain-containing protein n=4 Tax=Triticinae TaxID=1648030 RepID=A0A453B6G6_AEGTS